MEYVVEHERDVAVVKWHEAVNSGDLAWAAEVVTDPVEVAGPQGFATLGPREFAAWVQRSQIVLEPYEWHPISASITVVRQRATWPDEHGRTAPVEVVTVFVVSGDQIAAALRFDDFDKAMETANKRVTA